MKEIVQIAALDLSQIALATALLKNSLEIHSVITLLQISTAVNTIMTISLVSVKQVSQLVLSIVRQDTSEIVSEFARINFLSEMDSATMELSEQFSTAMPLIVIKEIVSVFLPAELEQVVA